MEKDSKKRLFEVMARLDKTFKPSLNEWNFDKKKGEGKEEGKESKEHEEKEEKDSGKKKWNFEKKEDKESEKHEESETPEEEKEEHEEKEELDEVKPKIPVNAIAKVGGKKVNERYGYDDDDEDDPDAGHTVNGKLLTPEEYRKWKEEEGEYDDMDRERYPRRRYEESGNMEEEIISEESNNSPINKFIMFGFNFSPNFISEVWADNQNLANHLQEKFKSIYDRHGANAAVFVFYTELDAGNKRKFEDWVTQNYNG